LAYEKNANCKIDVEILIGYGVCHIIAETSEAFSKEEVEGIVKRIAGNIKVNLASVKQDPSLAAIQKDKLRCSDNGIFKGVPLTEEQKEISKIARDIYSRYPSDGKYILDEGKLVICQSNATNKEIKQLYPQAIVNPLGEWTGGTNVDAGATNHKTGSDMADSVASGGLHGKDLSKCDVSVNIYAFLKAQKTNQTVQFSCAIGDDTVDGKSYDEIVKIAKEYIDNLGGFEKLAEWGLY
jgi:S-adenosylmethionine synthetase